MAKNRLISNFLHLTSLQGLSFVIPLITAPYLFRVLGAQKYGLVSFSLVVMAFLRIIVDYGFQLSATREVALNKDNKERLSDIYSQVMVTKLFLLLTAFVILNLLIVFVKEFGENWELFYISFLFVVGHTIFPIWFFQGIEEMQYISYLNIASKLLFLISILIFIKSPKDYLLYPFFNGMWLIAVALFGVYIVIKKHGIYFIKQPFAKVAEMLKSGWSIFLGEVAPSLYMNAVNFLLGIFVSMESVGYFNLAERVVSAATSILYIVRNVTFPYLNRNFEKFKKVTAVMFFMGLGFTIFLVSTANLFVPLLFGDKSSEIERLIYLLAISPTLYALILSFGTNYLLVLKKDALYKKITIYTSLFGVAASFAAIKLFKLDGAVFTVIFTQAVLVLFLIKAAYETKEKRAALC